jgi:4-amino-4-deoxy-L-arabinose transferase-like glycosyltransferase
MRSNSSSARLPIGCVGLVPTQLSDLAMRSKDIFLISLLVILFSVRFINLGCFDLQAWDEALYAVRAKSIYFFNCFFDQSAYSIGGLYSATHPPLYIWFTTLAFYIFGISEFSARFFSTFFGLGTLFMIYLIAKNLFNSKVAFFSTLFLLVNPFFTFWTMQGQFDVTLSFFFSATFYFYIRSIEESSNNKIILAALLLGCALMTKLFVALYILVVILTYECFGKNKLNWKNIFKLFFISAIVALPWHLFMILSHSNFDILFFLKQAQLYERAFHGIEANTKELGFFFYINQLFVYLPFFIVPIFYFTILNFKKLRTNILFLWMFLYLLIISAVSTKLPVYIIQIFIPAIVIGVYYYFEYLNNETSKSKKILFLSFIFIFIFWSLDQQFRTDVKNLLTGNGDLSFWKLLFIYKNIILSFLTIEIVLVLLIFFVKYNCTNIIITAYSAICLFIYFNNISYSSLQHYNGGVKEIVTTLNEVNSSSVRPSIKLWRTCSDTIKRLRLDQNKEQQ